MLSKMAKRPSYDNLKKDYEKMTASQRETFSLGDHKAPKNIENIFLPFLFYSFSYKTFVLLQMLFRN